MQVMHNTILKLLNYVTIDSKSIVCHFYCPETDKEVISELAFEPYEGKIEITWKDILLHPVESYNKYYHTPIVIYSKETHETLVIKAFQKVSSQFEWSSGKNKYICH